jgi:ABC-type multidrug transport system permease subunit
MNYMKKVKIKNNSETQKKFFLDIDLSTIIASLVVTTLIFSFFFMLSRQTHYSFGINEIIFATALSITSALILVWIKKMIIKNPYLGLASGLFAIGLAIYSLYINFTGFYTNMFAIASTIVVLSFVGFNFYMHRQFD